MAEPDRPTVSRYDPGAAARIAFGIAAVTWSAAAIALDRSVIVLLRDFGVSEIAIGYLVLIGLIAAIAVVPLGIWAYFRGRANKRKNQALRDLEANDDGEFVLYLRPFFSDRRVYFPNPFANAEGRASDSPIVGPEEFVGRTLERHFDVRQVGGGPDTIGAGRVFVTDETWQAAVIDSVVRARAVVIMPMLMKDKARLRGEATVWELQHLVETGAIAKTVVLMPYGGVLNRFRVSRAWRDVRQRAANFGLDLPKYYITGEAITFARGEGGRWKVATKYGRKGNTYWRLGQGLLCALADLQVIPPRPKNPGWIPLTAGV